ncbi:MAG TPA: fibronectin type III domain-containing protein [Holophagaceae bacterium]|nr:fibronectin type III domain-containing protein [Holophagaceae bacterium]
MRGSSSGFLGVLLCLAILACGGGGGGSQPTATPPPTRPKAPTALVATQGASIDQLDLTWTPPTGTFSGYFLDARLDAGEFQRVNKDPFPADTISIHLTIAPSVPDLTEFGFRLYVVQGGMVSPPSNEAIYQLGVRPPTGLQLDATNPFSQHLSWVPPTSVGTQARLERSVTDPLGGVGAYEALPTGLGATSFVDTDIREGRTYTYRLTFFQGGTDSTPVTATAGPVPVPAPSGVTVVPTQDSATLSWTNHSIEATQILILRSAGATPESLLATLPAGAATYTDSALPVGIYTYRVVAWVSDFHTGYGEQVTTQTLPRPGSLGLAQETLTLPTAAALRRSQGGQWRILENDLGQRILHTQTGMGWDDHPLDATGGFVAARPQVDLDQSGMPHLVYAVNYDGADQTWEIRHEWFAAGAWHSETVTRSSLDTSSNGEFQFLVQSNGDPQVFWRTAPPTGANGAPTYALKSGGVWQSAALPPEGVPSPLVVTYSHIAAAPDGTFYLVAYLGARSYLITRSPVGAWSYEEIPFALDGGSLPRCVALACDGLGALTLLYETDFNDATGSRIDQHRLRRNAGVWSSADTFSYRTDTSSATQPLTLVLSPDGLRTFVVASTEGGTVAHVWDGAHGWVDTLLGPNPIDLHCWADLDDQGRLHVLTAAAVAGTHTSVYTHYYETP